jgi:hypothetical protein
MPSLVRWINVVFFALVLTAAPRWTATYAQETTPEPGGAAAALLPEAAPLGPGWTIDVTVSPSVLRPRSFVLSPDVFREGAARIYLGPAGGRILIVTLLLTESRVAVRQGWEDATELLALIVDDASTDAVRTEQLATLPPPPGCVEAKRNEGTQHILLQPLGVTMCAVDPDLIVIASVSGDWSGQAGTAASDHLVALVTQPMTTPGPPATPATPQS